MAEDRFTKPVAVRRVEEIRWISGGGGGTTVPAGTPPVTDPQSWGEDGGSGGTTTFKPIWKI